MSCYVDMFHKIPQNHHKSTNPYGICSLIRHYHLHFDPKSGQGKCAIKCILGECNICNDQLNLPWIKTLINDKHPRYQLPQPCIYSTVLVELNEWKIITLKNKDTDKNILKIVHQIF